MNATFIKKEKHQIQRLETQFNKFIAQTPPGGENCANL